LTAELLGIGFSYRCNVALTDHDRRLLERCLKREGNAWREFVDRFAGLFVHVIRHTAQARSVDLAESDIDDLCAEVFLAILSDDMAVLRRFRGESSLATYLTVIARRIVVREVISRRMAEAFGHVKSHTANLELAGADISEISRIENQELVERMLDGLTETDASVIRQYHLEGRSYREIGEKLGIPENSIGPTLSRAREKLRQSLSASFG
jgi:RNA polymerase sigma-70 factor (ECF subfamily)